MYTNVSPLEICNGSRTIKQRRRSGISSGVLEIKMQYFKYFSKDILQ